MVYALHRRPVARHRPAVPAPARRPARCTNVSGIELVRQSIETILDTEPGERIMLPDFGCGLRRYLMEPNTLATRTLDGQVDITGALQRWEPRIRLTNVAVTPGEDPSVGMDRDRVRAASRTCRPDNLVYPFYLG